MFVVKKKETLEWEKIIYFLKFWGVYSKRFNPKIIPRKKNGLITAGAVGMLHAKQGKQKCDVHQHIRK